MAVESSGGGGTVPTARSGDLVVTESDDEVIIYDVNAKHIHHLNEVSAAIWRLCDGRRSMAEIALAASEGIGATVDEDAVAAALMKLDDANLLTGPTILPRTRRRWSRRKVAMLGAAAVPAVVSITAPLASASASDGISRELCKGAGPLGLDELEVCPDRADGYCCIDLTRGGRHGVCKGGYCDLFPD